MKKTTGQGQHKELNTKKVDVSSPAVKVIEEIDLVIRVLEKRIDDEAFVQWLTNEITAFALLPTVDKSVLSATTDNWSESDIISLIRITNKHASNEFVQRDAFKTIADLVCDKDDLRVVVAREGGVELVTHGMIKFPDNELLQEYGCLALGNLAANDDIAKTIKAQGGTKLIVRAMTEFPNNVRLLEWGCMALGNLALNHAICIEINKRLGGVELICQAMKAFPTNERVQRYACFAIGNLALKEDELRVNIYRQGGLEFVFKAMTQFDRNEKLQESGCFALGNLSLHSESCLYMVEHDVVGLTVRAMKRFPNNSTLQRNGCFLFWSLASMDNKNRLLIASKGCIRLVVDAMKKFPLNEKIQEFGCVTFGKLAVMEKNGMEIAKLGGIELVVQALNKFPDVETIQQFGCFALANVADASDSTRISVTEQGGLDLCIRATERFGSNETLQANCCCAFGNLASSHVRDQAMNTLDLIVDAMKRYPANQEIAWLGCYALEKWGSVSIQCRSYVESIDGVNLARHVWEDVLSKESKIRLKRELSAISDRFIFDAEFLLR